MTVNMVYAVSARAEDVDVLVVGDRIARADDLSDVFGRQLLPRQLTRLPRLIARATTAVDRAGTDGIVVAHEIATELADLREVRDVITLRLAGQTASTSSVNA
ncbi:hypothetical protein ABEG17_02550 [Pedococcus sp. KACC 23699]|uniref:Uncharacterized protein n=1 Tax=Pedococcus sp. KACC 23699 TaxID=3149228 RepID=A0AAU7JVN6_9MICO